MNTEKTQNKAVGNDKNSGAYLTRIMAAAGYVLLAVAAMMVLLLATKYFNNEREYIKLSDGQSTFSFLIQYYTLELAVLIGALISGNFGIRLLFGANKGAAEIIPAKDRQLLEPLIQSSNKEAINQYVILSSLTGFTGTFQKIGFSGLPLATVTLTLVFSLLSFFNIEFMELAKLTLGAFIGSFVQKGQDQISFAQESNKG